MMGPPVDEKVRNTGIAIERARSIIDQAMPRKQNPFLPDFNYAELAPLYALAHWGIEIGLKAILLLEDNQYDPKEDRHDLKKPFLRLKESNSEIANHLIKAFNDTVSFYTIDKCRWKHFKSLDAYLEQYGREDLYVTFRYWALADKELDHIPLFVHRELLVALEKLLGWNHQQVASKRVKRWVRWKFSEEVRGHIHACHSCKKDLPQPFLEVLNDSYPSNTPFREKLQYLYNQHAKKADDGCMNRIIRGAFESFRRDDDPAVRYLVNTLDDLPEGSLEKPSDIELQVEWVVHDIAGIVWIKNGQQLGLIRQSIDGRWLAQSYSPPTNSIVAKTKTDAKNWLVEECTEIVRVSVNGGPYTPTRVVSPALLGRPFAITFVNSTRGLTVGQHIDVKSIAFPTLFTQAPSPESMEEKLNGETPDTQVMPHVRGLPLTHP